MAEQADDSGVEQTMLGKTLHEASPPPEIGHFLSYSDGEITQRLTIGPQGLAIGRTPANDVTLDNAAVSRRHCKIELQGDWAILTDLGSTNGTFLDGAKIDRPTRLRTGASIAIGAYRLKYQRRDLTEVAQENELTADLKRAEQYVRAILPQPIAAGPVRAEWCFIPSATLGGDAFGYQYVGADDFTGFLLDVAGHGIGSAMHAANVANTLRRRALPGVDFRDPAQVAAGLNEMFPMEEHNGLMLTIWYFCYHLPTRELKFCAAGHHAAQLVAPGLPAPQPVWQRSPGIGFLPFGTWREGSIAIPPAARLYVFSDGAFEIFDRNGRQWSIGDLQHLIAQPPEPGVPEPRRLFNAVRQMARPGPLDDDFSLLLLSFD